MFHLRGEGRVQGPLNTSLHSRMRVWVKKNPPWGLVAIFPKRLGIFQPNFTRP